MTMKWNDPIVADVRKTREDLCKKAGGFGPYMKKLRAKEAEHNDRLIPTKKQLKKVTAKGA